VPAIAKTAHAEDCIVFQRAQDIVSNRRLHSVLLTNYSFEIIKGCIVPWVLNIICLDAGEVSGTKLERLILTSINTMST
jgi:hypothetical protein